MPLDHTKECSECIDLGRRLCGAGRSELEEVAEDMHREVKGGRKNSLVLDCLHDSLSQFVQDRLQILELPWIYL